MGSKKTGVSLGMLLNVVCDSVVFAIDIWWFVKILTFHLPVKGILDGGLGPWTFLTVWGMTAHLLYHCVCLASLGAASLRKTRDGMFVITLTIEAVVTCLFYGIQLATAGKGVAPEDYLVERPFHNHWGHAGVTAVLLTHMVVLKRDLHVHMPSASAHSKQAVVVIGGYLSVALLSRWIINGHWPYPIMTVLEHKTPYAAGLILLIAGTVLSTVMLTQLFRWLVLLVQQERLPAAGARLAEQEPLVAKAKAG
ncbi:unnamed protein product [Vitrella brassicaformis CCMP3155]|uniref:Uncharacterized protein n=2 Tax=Vitrella brassicaformis TaxID=1169539 RepID=A0A0G4ETX8_VITBC|nr:unnamed protein product [Vitrella brassicaformis CCMP3155]|eukprot:CEM01518.1 unnamed protein product [Vitrella brassicaformis CCMP3155]